MAEVEQGQRGEVEEESDGGTQTGTEKNDGKRNMRTEEEIF